MSSYKGEMSMEFHFESCGQEEATHFYHARTRSFFSADALYGGESWGEPGLHEYRNDCMLPVRVVTAHVEMEVTVRDTITGLPLTLTSTTEEDDDETDLNEAPFDLLAQVFYLDDYREEDPDPTEPAPAMPIAA